MYAGTQFLLPKTTCVRARTRGATRVTAGLHSRSRASASAGVRVSTLPAPRVTPPLEALPGMMRRLLAPMFWMVRAMAALEPSPISAMAMTAATPMTMPSVVSAERMMLRRSA